MFRAILTCKLLTSCIMAKKRKRKIKKECIERIRTSQPARKVVEAYTFTGKLKGRWCSIRLMCIDLELDRRAVLRAIKKDSVMARVKGFSFKIIE